MEYQLAKILMLSFWANLSKTGIFVQSHSRLILHINAKQNFSLRTSAVWNPDTTTTLTQLLCRSNVLVVQKFTAVQLFVQHADKLRVPFQSISSH